MSAAAARIAETPRPAARLFAEGEIGLHQAVDELQAAAERDGLVDQISQNKVQAIIAEAFAKVC
jgi:hypothetical protein